jgi:hypothetical protein
MYAVRHGVPWAGLAAAPTAWAVNQQLNYMIVPWVCADGVNLIPFISLLLAALALGGGYLSWSAYRSGGIGEQHSGGHPRKMLAGISILLALLLALTILMQGAAALILDPCAS